MAADDIAAVNLPPVMPTSDAPPDKSRQENEKNKHKGKSQKRNQERQDIEPAKPQSRQPKPKLREGKSPDADINFEPPEHELDKFA